jgi:hypothetical protein
MRTGRVGKDWAATGIAVVVTAAASNAPARVCVVYFMILLSAAACALFIHNRCRILI